MDNKKYWLRGLVAGVIFYILFLLITYILLFILGHGQATTALANGLSVIAGYISPILPLGLLIGWIYGKIPKLAILLSVLVLIFMIGLELLIVKNTFYPQPYTPQPSVYNGQPYIPQPSLYK